MVSSSALISFYQSQGTDLEGRTIQEIWDFDPTQKESDHHYIQWLFPTTTPSDYYLDAPILTPEDIQVFKKDQVIKKNMKRSFQEMLHFYGFEYREDQGEVYRATNFEDRKKVWLHPNNHNYLRITRILDSLSTLGFEKEAQAFFYALAELNQADGKLIVVYGESSFPFWQKAVEGSFYDNS